MQNGKGHIKITALIKVLLLLIQIKLTAQSYGKEQSLSANSYKSFQDCKSKSKHTSKPTILKVSLQKIAQIKTIKELIPDIPQACSVFCTAFNLKMKDDKEFLFLNVGNDIVYLNKLLFCKSILIENVVTSCPDAHKANYKIIIEY